MKRAQNSDSKTHVNKLASLEATLVRNYDPATYLLTGEKCRATSVAKNHPVCTYIIQPAGNVFVTYTKWFTDCTAATETWSNVIDSKIVLDSDFVLVLLQGDFKLNFTLDSKFAFFMSS